METLCARWGELGLDRPWHSPRSSWRGGLCERTGPSLCGVPGLSRRNFSKRKSGIKRHSGTVWGILLQQQLQPPLHPAAWGSHGGVEGTEPTSETPGRVRTSEDLWAHIRWTRESAHHWGPSLTPYHPRRVQARPCGTRGCWGTALEVGWLLIRKRDTKILIKWVM